MHTCKTAGATHLREVRSSLAGRRRRSPGATRSSCCRPDACFPRRPCRRLSDARSRKLRQVHIMIVLIEIVLPVPRAQQVRCTMDPWYCTGPGTGYRLTGKQVQVPSYCRASRTAVLGWSLFCSAALLGPCAHQSALLVREYVPRAVSASSTLRAGGQSWPQLARVSTSGILYMGGPDPREHGGQLPTKPVSVTSYRKPPILHAK